MNTLFIDIKDKIIFESFNVFERAFVSKYPFFNSELMLINTIDGKGDTSLLYGKLFIEGQEIEGFPPLMSKIVKILKTYNIVLKNEDSSPVIIDNPEIKTEDYNKDKIIYKIYSSDNLIDSCLLCTKYHPALCNKKYDNNDWKKYEKLKEEFVKISLNNQNVIGFIAYYEKEPIGFIEAFSLNISRKLGFLTTSEQIDAMMITCLSIRKEFNGLRVGSNLIENLENEAKNRNYKSIEVYTFLDEHKWQPKTLYLKRGYKVVNEVNSNLLKKELFDNDYKII